MRNYCLILFFAFFIPIFLCSGDSEDGIFLARITSIDEHDARKIGRRHGFEALQSFSDVYIGRRLRRRKRGIEDEILAEMIFSEQIQFIEKLYRFRRFKRAPMMNNGAPIHVVSSKTLLYLLIVYNSSIKLIIILIALKFPTKLAKNQFSS
ncbi:hypothetical protein B9Z55_003788 [Caenorhabditis nigoni]|uniref:Peptidase S8 pro-domain domain-containing protein n=1 Tax=Caenorhabditis nigoni TaxID=1611254 RepID=A0A2G5VS71_9PELO|nr:hypothetical protein B9Z55_003788 [Caenorhabditis nigoni]